MGTVTAPAFDWEWMNSWLAGTAGAPKAEPVDIEAMPHVSDLPPGTPGTPYGLRGLENLAAQLAEAPVGTRNHTLNSVSFAVGALVAGGHLEEARSLELIEHTAFSIGLEAGEIAATIRSGYTSGLRRPRVIEPREAPSWLDDATLTLAPAAEAPSDSETESAVRRHLPLIDWHALWADESEEDWIIEPLLAVRRLVALYSAPKVGKSLLVLELAVAISQGARALGASQDRARRVLYVDFENDPRGDIRERLESMGVGPDDLGNLCYLSFPALSGLDSENGSRELMAAVAEYRCEVVVIDTVSRAVTGDENENDTWLNFYRHTGMKLKAAGVACLRLDHSGKDEAKGMRGGSAKYGDVDAVWRLTRPVEEQEVFELICEAHRMPVLEKRITLHRETGPLRHRVDGRMFAAADITRDAVVKAMDDAGLPNDTGVPTARTTAKAAGVRAGKAALERAVQQRKSRMSPESGALSPWGQVGDDPLISNGLPTALPLPPYKGAGGEAVPGQLPSEEGGEGSGDLVPDVRSKAREIRSDLDGR